MKLKCILNGAQQPSDYKLFKTTISTVGSIRKTALLRFSDDNLVIISSPKSFSSALDNVNGSKLTGNNNNLGSGISGNSFNSLQNEKGQIWCTVPKDVFRLYSIQSIRDNNTLSMEFSCDSLINVLKRYDKVLSSGSASDMIIKLQMAPDWVNSVSHDLTNDKKGQDQNGNKKTKKNHIVPIYALGITFDEVITTANEYNPVGSATTTTSTSTNNNNNNANDESENAQSINQLIKGNSRTIVHHYKVPVRILFKNQDLRIVEPLINVNDTPMVLRLPSVQDEYGIAFQNFMKRVERYSMINHLKLQVNDNLKVKDDIKLNILVNEAEWDLKISWKGPLDKIDTGMEANSNDSNGSNQYIANNKNNNDHYNHNLSNHGVVAQSNSTSLESNNSDQFRIPTLISPLNDSNINMNEGYDNTQLREEQDLLHIDDSDLNMSNVKYVTHPDIPNNTMPVLEVNNDKDNSNDNHNKTLEEINAMVEKAEMENNSIYSVMLKIKDWKICTKLYSSFDNVLLAVMHDKSCILHCFLERDFDSEIESVDNIGSNNGGNADNNNTKGQIIYYILRSKSIT